MKLKEILNKILGREKAAARTPRQGGDYTDFFNTVYGSSSPLQIATVFACVRHLQESVAALDVKCMKRKGGIFVEDNSSSLALLLNLEPNPWDTAYDLKRRIVAELLLEGNAYIIPHYENIHSGYPSALTLCPRGSVAHDTERGIYSFDGNDYGEDEMIHIKGHVDNINPKRGISVLSYARQNIDIASQGDTETLSRFANGGTVRGVLSNDTTLRGYGRYADEELQKAARGLDERFSRGERIVSSPGDTKFSPLSLSSTDMQFLETRKFTVLEICRFFGVHPSFIYADTASNYKSVEMANVAFLSHTLNPLLINIEQELKRKLYSPKLWSSVKICFDRSSLYSSDLDTRVSLQTKRLAAGLATVNELRREDNLPPVEGGDKVLVSANLRDVSEIEDGNDDNNNDIENG